MAEGETPPETPTGGNDPPTGNDDPSSVSGLAVDTDLDNQVPAQTPQTTTGSGQ